MTARLVLVLLWAGLSIGCFRAGAVQVRSETPGADVYVRGRTTPVGQTPTTVFVGGGTYGSAAEPITVKDADGHAVEFTVYRQQVTLGAVASSAFTSAATLSLMAFLAGLGASAGWGLIAVAPYLSAPGWLATGCIVCLMPIPLLAMPFNAFTAQGQISVDLAGGHASSEPAAMLTDPFPPASSSGRASKKRAQSF